MTDHNLRDIASRCEAKLHGLRRTAEGAVISFVIHPNEIPRALMLDALGTRYMLAFVAIGDDEAPIPASRHEIVEVTSEFQQGMSADGRIAPNADCITVRRERGARYAAMTAGEQAVQKAAMLPKDQRFQAWGPGVTSELHAVAYIRERCCDGNSRKMIAEVPEYMDRFQQMLTEFMIAVGELPEPR